MARNLFVHLINIYKLLKFNCVVGFCLLKEMQEEQNLCRDILNCAIFMKSSSSSSSSSRTFSYLCIYIYIHTYLFYYFILHFLF